MQNFYFLINYFILLFIFAKNNFAQSQNNPDEIIDKLPLLDFKLNFKHYSGYLQISKTKFLHYMLTNSKNNPEKDPVIFWYNGGPGCSSLLGLFTELGPYLLNKDGSKLIENPHSWNNNASVVFIESPAGVGFSYATDGNVATNDNIAADDNYLAIKQFFKKYPKFLKNDIFITGESYAGIYLPMLTSLIVKGMSKFKINLKGLAIGNPYLNKKIDYESNLIYAYGHGVVDEELWQSVKKDCCKGCVDGCDIENLVGRCSNSAIQIYNSFFNGNINAYDIYRNCGNSPNASSYQKYDMFSRAAFRLKNMAKLAKKAKLNIMEEDTRRVKRDDGSSFDPSLVPCLAGK
uniref:Carboxypeptidase n=1 Tax=Meloidogyne incognita TaxID=6306 RepID=A0A914LVR4_MELIC